MTLVQTSIVSYHLKLRPLLNLLVHPRLNNLLILRALSLDPTPHYLSRVCRPPDRFWYIHVYLRTDEVWYIHCQLLYPFDQTLLSFSGATLKQWPQLHACWTKWTPLSNDSSHSGHDEYLSSTCTHENSSWTNKANSNNEVYQSATTSKLSCLSNNHSMLLRSLLSQRRDWLSEINTALN